GYIMHSCAIADDCLVPPNSVFRRAEVENHLKDAAEWARL
ncbi:MAG: hypothetical protein QOH85_263, partial [Acidobacteriaceae bacterium]|nr:hypothetical protein [Acidobacteriaceae bacterium]